MACRPVRVASCAGFATDPTHEMYLQATLGDVDFITGDYLAEMNLGSNADAYAAGKTEGYENSAYVALEECVEVLNEKGTKVAINGGSQNPAGLAKKVNAMIQAKGLELKVGYVEGDNLLAEFGPNLASLKERMPSHLDSENSKVQFYKSTFAFKEREDVPLVSANAYLGAHAIVEGFRRGCDIIICGRVADASPVIAAAWYWHNWTATDYDQLAGTLIAGHLIECSAYVTGGNFSGLTFENLDQVVHPGFPIAEIAADGSCIISKHEGTSGFITEDTVKCQFLYELQGSVYLNSDVKAYLNDVEVSQVGKDRVRVSGIKGKPPPPTTKMAIFYRGGFQCQLLLNGTGYGTKEKWTLLEKQIRRDLGNKGFLDKFVDLQFQVVGVPEPNPSSQLASTTYCRIFAEALHEKTIMSVLGSFSDLALRHFSGLHSTLDFRTAFPTPFLSYFPAIYPQDKLVENFVMLDKSNSVSETIFTGHPPAYEPLEARENVQVTGTTSDLGPTTKVRLGDIALARSGDKGSNMNCGIYVKDPKMYSWFRNFLSHEKFKTLMGEDWDERYFVERVEFPKIHALHFVVYGLLGRGVSGSSRLDALGKGFCDYFRDKVIEVPNSLL